jgi:ankyrin repeat protein
MRSTFVSFPPLALMAAFAFGGAIRVAAHGSLLDAVRRDDAAAVAATATDPAVVNAPDDTGATPLMYAVLYSRPAIVNLLIDRGAAVDGTNRFGSTALMWAAARTPIVKTLLAHGADVNAKASDGTTPIVVAARVRNIEAMQAMIAAGADMRSTQTRRKLLTAAYASPGSAVSDYLRSRHVTLASADDLIVPLLARQRDDVARLEEMLAAGADPNEEVPLITLSAPTDFLTVRGDKLGAVRMLEQAGVDPTARGPRGWTALMLAAGADAPSIPVLRHLLDAGVDVNAKDDDGRSALDWALTRGETAASELLRGAGGRASPPAPAPVRTTPPYGAREAVARAIARLQAAGPAFSNRTRCNSCHNQNLPGIAINAAAKRGVEVDQALANHSFDVTQQDWRGRRELALLGDTNRPSFQPNVEYGLLELAETGAEPTPATDAMVLGLSERQSADGSWPGVLDIRPPLSTTVIASTALALRGVHEFSPPGRREEMAARVARAADFLRRATPSDTQDHAFKLLGLLWAGAPAAEVNRERTALIGLQRADGGWAQMSSMSSDAYITGQALFALHAAGMAARDPVYRKGIDHLLATQLEDGTWFVRTRAFGFQPYFETGFPHGRSQFISTAATAWAATALAYTLSR